MQKGDTVTVTAFGYYATARAARLFFSLGSFLAGLFQPAQAPAPARGEPAQGPAPAAGGRSRRAGLLSPSWAGACPRATCGYSSSTRIRRS
ncbi:MAG: hypothetical protein WKG07_08050 [Hymenobacter sp.]